MNIEICTDSLEGALAADKYGAKRIELCSALSLGGLTPSYGLIEQCVKKINIEVHVIIRHKEGGFNYTSSDLTIMRSDIEQAKKAGASGVVFGILNDMFEVSDLNNELVEFAKKLDLEITFHRAFDFVINYKIAIEKIIAMGFDRLLTSGLSQTAEEGLDIITNLQNNYGSKIQIMAGSDINYNNALKIARSGINNIHFTAKKLSDNVSLKFSMGEVMITDEEKIRNITNLF